MSQSGAASPDAPKVAAHDVFEILVREHEPRLRAYVATLVRDSAAIDDLVQEAFVVAWRNLARYDRALPFGPWIRGIGHKLCLAHHRKRQRSKLAFVGDDVMQHFDHLFAELDAHGGDTLQDELASLRICFDKLPEHQQNVLRLHYEDQLDCGAIGQNTGRTREAVKKLLQRGRAWLGDCIAQRLQAMGLDAIGDGAAPSRGNA
ncbi:MAG: sigma-70 family RNA polymerase sigma factor [Planctomycetes bacterium]|nr:sigma-70 family RNA polymerase sigma factor [Planctomycetota bacterium]MCB9920273.1 sigma-70 family RNA polymerase sigma factor [Planctomycetota bacterium]